MASFRITKTWDGQTPSSPDSKYSITLELVRGEIQFVIDAPYFDDKPPPILPNAGGIGVDGGGDGGGGAIAPRGRYPGLYKYECVELFIASGNMEQGKETETPYLEIEIGPHGHFYMIGFLGEGQWETQDDELVFEHDPEIIIHHKTRRWYAKGIIPFYLLPEPGSDEADPLKLVWKLNFVAIHGSTSSSTSREYLSQNQLPKLNFHQLRYFSTFIFSDEDAQRLKSMSRSNRNWATNAELRLKSADFQRWASTDGNGSPPVVTTVELKSIEDVIEDIRIKSSRSEKMREQNNKFQALTRSSLLDGECVLLSGVFWKRKGWSHKLRLLCLTSRPRLIYFSAKAPYTQKGTIEWSLLKPITISMLPGSNDRFDMGLYDGTRTYHWFDEKEQGANIDSWIQAITQINQAWDRYLRQNFAYRNSAIVKSATEKNRNTQVGPPQCLLV